MRTPYVPAEKIAKVNSAKQRIEQAQDNLREALEARRRAVLELRADGLSWGQIGELIGVTRTRAQKIANNNLPAHPRLPESPVIRL